MSPAIKRHAEQQNQNESLSIDTTAKSWQLIMLTEYELKPHSHSIVMAINEHEIVILGGQRNNRDNTIQHFGDVTIFDTRSQTCSKVIPDNSFKFTGGDNSVFKSSENEITALVYDEEWVSTLIEYRRDERRVRVLQRLFSGLE